MRARPAVIVLLSLLALATAAGCASTTRERCSSESAGEPPSDRDAVLVKRLVRALYMDDFPAFERLQPTESQYVTLAWRFGAVRADELLAFARDRAAAQRHFAAVRKDLVAKRIDARTAARCTRRFATEADEPRLYTLDIALGEPDQATHLSALVFDSSNHASFVGPLDPSALTGLVHELLELAEGLIRVVETHAATPALAVEKARAYLARHGARHRELQARLAQATPESAEQGLRLFASLVRRQTAVAERWQRALEKNPGLAELTPELTAEPPPAPIAPEPEPEPTPAPTPD